MDIVTTDQATRVAERMARDVAAMRRNAERVEREGGPDDVMAEGYGLTITRAQQVHNMRDLADSRERAAAQVVAGRKIRKA